MSAKIPKSIREQVIKQWLQGMSRDQIAKDNGIGAGTVSSIIKDAKQEIPDIDLLRQTALVLKKHDLNLSVFASSIRIKNKLDGMGVNEDKIDSLIDNANTHCFKRGLTADEYFNNVDKVCALSENLEMPLDELPSYIIRQQLELEKVEKETEDAKLKQRQVLQNYDVTMDVLEEYRRNKPLIDRIKQLEKKLEEAEEENNYLAEELASKESEIKILESKPNSFEYE
jgi:transcriptional regulator with XRE-family HTH domain